MLGIIVHRSRSAEGAPLQTHGKGVDKGVGWAETEEGSGGVIGDGEFGLLGVGECFIHGICLPVLTIIVFTCITGITLYYCILRSIIVYYCSLPTTAGMTLLWTDIYTVLNILVLAWVESRRSFCLCASSKPLPNKRMLS